MEPPFTKEQAEDLVNLCNIKIQGDEAEMSESEQKGQEETTEFGIWSLVKGKSLVVHILGILNIMNLYFRL